tara:strand:- start:7068 stop:7265 length:198 start_codon:yes stop_codon:yes gene_type:complete
MCTVDKVRFFVVVVLSRRRRRRLRARKVRVVAFPQSRFHRFCHHHHHHHHHHFEMFSRGSDSTID